MFGAACMQRRKKTGIYEFRRVVPERLRPIIGKREIVRSLGTRNTSDAKSLHNRIWQEVEELFQQAEERLKSAEQPLVWDDPNFTQAHAEGLAAQWLAEQLAADADGRAASLPLTAMQATLQDMAGTQDEEIARSAIRMRHYDLVTRFVSPIIEKHKLPFAYQGPAWRRLAAAVARAVLHLIQERKKRAEGDWPLALSPLPSHQATYVGFWSPKSPTSPSLKPTPDAHLRRHRSVNARSPQRSASQSWSRRPVSLRSSLLASVNGSWPTPSSSMSAWIAMPLTLKPMLTSQFRTTTVVGSTRTVECGVPDAVPMTQLA